MKKISLLCISALLLLAPGAVSAHATPVTYSPEASAVAERVPERVIIFFSERIDPAASDIMVYGPDGSEARAGRPEVGADPHEYGVSLRGAGEGTYAVSWRVVSADDGHFTKGAFSFSVGAPGGNAPQAEEVAVVHSSSWPEAATIWAELFGQAILLGVLIALAFLRRREDGDEPSARRAVRFIFAVGVALVLGGGAAYLALRSYELYGISGGIFADSFGNFAATVAGKYTIYRMLLGAAFAAVLLAFQKRIFSKERSVAEYALYALLVGMAFTRAKVSHAAASHFWPELSVLVNWIHVLFKEMWIGGVAAFAALWFAWGRGSEERTRALLRALSRAAAWALAVGGATGAYVVWLHLKSPENAFTTVWGSRFIVLNVLAAALLALRLYHQLSVERNRKPGAFSRLGLTLGAEAFVAAAVLFSSSLLIITTPPLEKGGMFYREAADRGVHIVLGEDPRSSQPKNFLIEVHTGLQVRNAVVSLTNAERSIGPIVVAPEKVPLGYAFPQAELSPPGRWRIDVTIQKERAYDSNMSFEIDYPRDLSASEDSPRAFDGFAAMSILAASGLIALAYWLRRQQDPPREEASTEPRQAPCGTSRTR